LPRNCRLARSQASQSPMTNASAVEMAATRRLSHSGNQSMGIGLFMVAQALEDAAFTTVIMVFGMAEDSSSSPDGRLPLLSTNGAPGSADSESELARFSRLVAMGGLTRGKGNLRRHWKPTALKPGPSTTEMIAEDRR
jgi:hypothetical protein